MRMIVLLVVGVGLAGIVGIWGARIEVAKDKAVAKIDSLLGGMEVKRKEIELSLSALKNGLRGLQKAKIMAQVRYEQIGRRIEPIEHEVATLDGGLGRLRDILASQSSLQVGGKIFPTDDLNIVAQNLLERRKDQSDQINGLRAAQGGLRKVVTTLEGKRRDYERRLTGIESQLSLIDANQVALNAMKDAALATDSGDKSMAENVSKLEESVNNLYAEVEAGLRMEDTEWDIVNSEKKITAADDILKMVRTPGDTFSQIDAIRGQSKIASISN